MATRSSSTIRPQFSHSQSNHMGNIADLIAEAGHNVTSLIPTMNERISPGTSKSKIIFVEAEQAVRDLNNQMMDADFFEESTFNPMGNYIFGRVMAEIFSKSCRKTLEVPGLINRLKDENFDVVIAESFDICGLGIAHIIKPKAIINGLTTPLSFGHMIDEAGVPHQLSFSPSMYTTHLDTNSIPSRFWNIIGDFMVRIMTQVMRIGMRELFVEKYGPNFPTFADISSNVAYTFENSEPLIDFAVPTLHRVLNIGGLGAKEPKPLSEDWLEVLNRREKTVLISFGSIAHSHSFKVEIKRGILKTVAHFPNITFIWKYEKPEDEFSLKESSQIPNLFISKWTPQNDLLNHEKIAAFISHGGMGSTQEAARRGVPEIFVPIFGDQPRNAGMMEHNRLGKVFNKYALHDAEKLIAALKEILEDDSYMKRCKQVAKMIKEKPISSRDLLIKSVEFAAEFGPSPALRPASYDMSAVEYYNLDIIAIVALLTVLTVFVVFVLVLFVRMFIRMCVGIKLKRD